MTDRKPRGDKTANKPKAALTEKADTAPKQTVGALVTKLLADPNLGYVEIIELVKADFPQAQPLGTSIRRRTIRTEANNNGSCAA